MANADLQLRKGVLELAILAQLKTCPTYGGDLIETLNRKSSLEVSQGTIYPLLARLRKGDLVTTRWVESPVGPPRKYYSLTRSGEAHLAQLVKSWRQLNSTIEDILEGHHV